MKKRLRHREKLLKIMKLTVMQMILATVFVSISYAHPSYAQKVLSQRINLVVEEKPVSEVLFLIEKMADVRFSYLPKQIQADRKITLQLENETLSKVLDKVFTKTSIRYEVVGTKQILLTKNIPPQYEKPNLSFTPVEKTVLTPQIIAFTVSGAVKDDKGEPMVGATVTVEGTQKGTLTDVNGKFSLELTDEEKNGNLLFSFVGYEKQTVAIGGKSVIDVILKANNALNEVIVVGYGNREKAKTTSAQSRMKAEDLDKYAGTSFEQQLAGKIAGVQINEFGTPGQNSQVIIRGISTLTAGTNPLIVVDGFPLTEGSSFNAINPKDIESIDILKDAASASIYGSRAANGVILIKTKDGSKGQMKVSLDVYTGVQQNDHNVDYVDAYDAAQFFTEARDWGYVSKNPSVRKVTDDRAKRIANGASLRELRLNYLDPYLSKQQGLTNTNWLNEVFRDAPMGNYQLAVSGGSDKTNYYISGSYFQQKGVTLGPGVDRYNLNFKLNSELKKGVNFGINLNPSFTKRDDADISTNWTLDPISMISISYPFFEPYKKDGSLNISEQIIASTPEDGALAENVVGLMTTVTNNRNDFRTFGNTYLSFDLFKGLNFKTSLGGDYRTTLSNFYNPSFIGQYRGKAPKAATTNQYSAQLTNIQSENLLNYNTKISNHDIDVLVGYSFQKENFSSTRIVGTGIPDDNIQNIAGASSYAVSPSNAVWALVSYFGRAQYAFGDKYLLSATVRRDGSSRFGDNSKWGLFPSVSAGWIVSREAFFPKSDAISFMKLRASWGKSGNNQIGSYSSQALVTGSDYVYGSTLSPGFATTTSPNPNLSWETNTATNIGIDLAFLSNKFNLTAEYYNSITSDLLLDVPVPQQSGFSSYLTNIGKVNNKGLELELGGKGIRLGAVNWSFSANASANRNEVLALAPGQTEIRQGQDGAWRTKVGGPIAEAYAYNIIGVFKTQAELDATPKLTGTLLGDYIVEDVNNDKKIDDNDKISMGTYAPELTYGFTSDFKYKNFGFNFSIVGVEGRRLLDWELAFVREVGEGFGMPSQYYFDNRYHPENNPNGFFAQPNLGNYSAARRDTRVSSIYFSDADYLRLRNVQLYYNLPTSFLQKARIGNARIYVMANNLFTLTKFRGYNPDGTSDNVLQMGYQRGNNYPVARTFIGGINLVF